MNVGAVTPGVAPPGMLSGLNALGNLSALVGQNIVGQQLLCKGKRMRDVNTRMKWTSALLLSTGPGLAALHSIQTGQSTSH